MAVARVHVRSWQIAYRTLLPQGYLDQLRPEDRARMYDFATTDPAKPHTLVAVEDGTILGFATTCPSRDADLPQHGELCALYVDPDHWQRQIGRDLVLAARERLSQFGFKNALLWTLAGNLRADRFYQIDGWKPDGTKRSQTLMGVPTNELRYQRAL